MTKLTLKLIGTCAIACLGLSACATPNTAPEAVRVDEPIVVAETAPAVPEKTISETAPAAKSDATQVAEKADKKDPNRRICKRQSVVGSNMKKKVCASAAQWDAEEKKAREFLDGVQKKSRTRGTSN